ncbi:helix-turn-helix transcriptional regulator [Ornithinimicrobium sp. W1665]|uniref:helix-turn-helix transcriptional regulator n=1 Tax=Ornithinimicrobium sp. W1665 TaxID=3416666 RepID=UPI003CEC5F79
MPTDEPIDRARGRAGARRSDILQALRASRHGRGIRDLAAATGLHENTVRFHLDRLVADGLVDRTSSAATGPGRPPLTYVARREPDEARDNYALIATVLGDALAGSTADPAAAARESGRAWGRGRLGRAVPTETDGWSWEAALDRLVVVQQDEGFAPEVDDGPGGAVLRVHHCPFLALSRQDRTLPCSVHLGLIEGVLGEAGTVERLEPFVTPSLCLAHLSPAGADTRA